MKTDRNFERAKLLTKDWPAWKREFELTKNSCGGSASVSQRQSVRSDTCANVGEELFSKGRAVATSG